MATLFPAAHHHDLQAILAEVRAHFFPGSSPVTIAWARRSGRARQRSMRFGTYWPDSQVIRIHPALDQAFVPRYFVEFIIYHELLHHVLPAVRVNGRYQIHSPAFREREREFPAYAEAMSWRRQSLRRLLRSNHRPRA